MENNKEEDYIPNQVISKENLKKYFENGDIPDEQDFWEWQDSYWHKNDPNDIIPAERVDLSGKSDKNATNLDGENVQNWRTKLNIENTDQDNIAIVHRFTLADIGATGNEDEETLNQLITDFINSLNITVGETEIHYFQLVDGEDSMGNSGGDFIPLIGTEVGKPVTGDIKINEDILFKIYQGTASFELEGGSATVKNNTTSISISDSGVQFNTNEVSSRGIYGLDYYGAGYDGLSFVQKKYVDDTNSYSTDEIKTGGTWINGTPIYRKVIEMAMADGHTDGLTELPNDIKELISIRSFYKYSAPSHPSIINTGEFGKNIFDTSIRSYIGTLKEGSTIYAIHFVQKETEDGQVGLILYDTPKIIIEYTKTTD